MGACFKNLEALSNLEELIPKLESTSNMPVHRYKIHFSE